MSGVGQRSPSAAACGGCALGAAGGGAACPFHVIHPKPGTSLLSQGERPTAIFYVERGQVLCSSIHADGEESACALRGPGTLLGLEALTGGLSDADAWTLGETALCRIRSDAFEAWLGTHPARARAALQLAVEETGRTRRDRFVLAGRPEVRVARFLAEHVRATSQRLDIEQQLLARILRLRPETVSRALGALRRRGVLATGRGLEVVDPTELERIAAGE